MSENDNLQDPPKRWTDEEIRLLGTMPDHVLATILGRTDWSVKKKRINLHIKPFVVPGRAAKAKTPPEYNQREWTSEEDELIGTERDAAIAKKLNRTVKAVQARRRHLGISRHDKRSWPKEHDALLGKMSDLDVANITGRTAVAVMQRRLMFGIPKFKSDKALGLELYERVTRETAEMIDKLVEMLPNVESRHEIIRIAVGSLKYTLEKKQES